MFSLLNLAHEDCTNIRSAGLQMCGTVTQNNVVHPSALAEVALSGLQLSRRFHSPQTDLPSDMQKTHMKDAKLDGMMSAAELRLRTNVRRPYL